MFFNDPASDDESFWNQNVCIPTGLQGSFFEAVYIAIACHAVLRKYDNLGYGKPSAFVTIECVDKIFVEFIHAAYDTHFSADPILPPWGKDSFEDTVLKAGKMEGLKLIRVDFALVLFQHIVEFDVPAAADIQDSTSAGAAFFNQMHEIYLHHSKTSTMEICLDKMADFLDSNALSVNEQRCSNLLDRTSTGFLKFITDFLNPTKPLPSSTAIVSKICSLYLSVQMLRLKPWTFLMGKLTPVVWYVPECLSHPSALNSIEFEPLLNITPNNFSGAKATDSCCTIFNKLFGFQEFSFLLHEGNGHCDLVISSKHLSSFGSHSIIYATVNDEFTRLRDYPDIEDNVMTDIDQGPSDDLSLADDDLLGLENSFEDEDVDLPGSNAACASSSSTGKDASRHTEHAKDEKMNAVYNFIHATKLQENSLPSLLQPCVRCLNLNPTVPPTTRRLCVFM